MGARQKAWAARARAALIQSLGGACVDCNDRNPAVLELDHLFRKDWIAREIASDSRVAIYRREAAAGLLAVRCRSCNAAKGRPHQSPPPALAAALEPF